MSRRRPFIFARAAAIAVAIVLSDVRAVLAQQPPTSIDPERVISDQIGALARRVGDPSIDQDTRDQAARKLLGIGRVDARNAINFALTDPANVGGRLAALRAISGDPSPDPQFIDPLFVLIDATQPRPLVEAAATALGNYKMLPDVTTRLIPLTDARRPEPVRLAAIRAMSTQIEKRAGERLAQLTTDPQPSVANAAIEALQTFASLPLGTAAEWADWWRTQTDVTEDRFRLETLAARATRLEVAQRRSDETFGELRRGTLATLAATPRDAQADALSRLLRSPVDAVRLIASRQAYDLATTGDLPVSARPAVRQLVGDPSADVRFEAARTAQRLNDAEAFDAIAQQVLVEPEARVRAELARAVGPIGNVGAVPLLRILLDDPSSAVVTAAAAGIETIGAMLAQQSPATAAQLATQLQAALQTRGAGDARVRESLVRAMVALRQPSLLPVFARMLTESPLRESNAVREQAVRGLGLIGDARVSDLLVETLRDEQPRIRLAAVNALGGTSKDFINAEPLYRRMNPAEENDPAVRRAAWDVLRKLLEVAPREQLAAWPDRALFKDELPKRLDLFAALAKKAESANDRDSQSSYIQAMGDTQMGLGQFADATASYRKALEISRAQRQSMVVVGLVESTLQSLLRGRDYSGAAKFATDLFKEPDGSEYQSSVGYAFKNEAARLAGDAQQHEDALKLIQTALAMQPALPPQYRDQLREIQRNVESRRREKNELDAHGWLDDLADAR